MIIENNGIKLDVKRDGRYLTYQVLEQSEDATKRLQSVSEVKDDDTGIAVRSNRFPSFNQENKRFYLRGLEAKKNAKIVEAEFRNEAEATEAIDGLRRVVNFLTPENFPLQNKQTHGKVQKGGTSHCRFYFINRAMSKILCLTGHNHYPIETIDWKTSKPVRTNNKQYNDRIAGVVNVLNTAKTNKASQWAINKVKDFFITSFKAGPSELVACWRTVTGFGDCDIPLSYNMYLQSGSTLSVRNAFLTNEMATSLGVKYSKDYNNRAVWKVSEPVYTTNKHYDEHIGQIVDVLNKTLKSKDYRENVVNHHKVGSKSSTFAVKMIKEALAEAHGLGADYLCALWSIMTGLRGPDFTD